MKYYNIQIIKWDSITINNCIYHKQKIKHKKTIPVTYIFDCGSYPDFKLKNNKVNTTMEYPEQEETVGYATNIVVNDNGVFCDVEICGYENTIQMYCQTLAPMLIAKKLTIYNKYFYPENLKLVSLFFIILPNQEKLIDNIKKVEFCCKKQ